MTSTKAAVTEKVYTQVHTSMHMASLDSTENKIKEWFTNNSTRENITLEEISSIIAEQRVGAKDEYRKMDKKKKPRPPSQHNILIGTVIKNLKENYFPKGSLNIVSSTNKPALVEHQRIMGTSSYVAKWISFGKNDKITEAEYISVAAQLINEKYKSDEQPYIFSDTQLTTVSKQVYDQVSKVMIEKVKPSIIVKATPEDSNAAKGKGPAKVGTAKKSEKKSKVVDSAEEIHTSSSEEEQKKKLSKKKNTSKKPADEILESSSSEKEDEAESSSHTQMNDDSSSSEDESEVKHDVTDEEDSEDEANNSSTSRRNNASDSEESVDLEPVKVEKKKKTTKKKA